MRDETCVISHPRSYAALGRPIWTALALAKGRLVPAGATHAPCPPLNAPPSLPERRSRVGDYGLAVKAPYAHQQRSVIQNPISPEISLYAASIRSRVRTGPLSTAPRRKVSGRLGCQLSVIGCLRPIAPWKDHLPTENRQRQQRRVDLLRRCTKRPVSSTELSIGGKREVRESSTEDDLRPAVEQPGATNASGTDRTAGTLSRVGFRRGTWRADGRHGLQELSRNDHRRRIRLALLLVVILPCRPGYRHSSPPLADRAGWLDLREADRCWKYRSCALQVHERSSRRGGCPAKPERPGA